MKTLLLLLLSFSVSAENWVQMGMRSFHPEKGLNEQNHSIGIEIDTYFIQKFENSMKDTAYYLGKYERDGYCLDKLCLGYSYGLLKGYSFKEVTPIAFAVISYEYEGIGADVSCIPGTVCAIQLRFSENFIKDLGINSPFDTKGYFEVSWDSFDPDGESSLGYERSNGVTYDAKIYLTDNVYLKGSYTNTDFGAQPDINEGQFTPVWQTGKPSQIDSRGSIQIGQDFEWLSIGVSYNQISIQESYLNRETLKVTDTPETHYRGFGAHFSKGYQLSEDWSFYGEAAIVSDLITDLRLTLETRYKLTDNIELTVRWIDGERWNMSQAQLGLRWNL